MNLLNYVLLFIKKHLLVSSSSVVGIFVLHYLLQINIIDQKIIAFIAILAIIEIYFWVIIDHLIRIQHSFSFLGFIAHLTSFSSICTLLFGWYYASFHTAENYLYSLVTQSHVHTFYESVYFSGVTFISIGYGDIVPVGFFQFVTLVEAFIGSFITLSFFTISITQFYITSKETRETS